MSKEEIFDILYGKEKWDIWRKFQEIENSIEESDKLYECFDDIAKMLYEEESYLKMRGFRIICRLSKWDREHKIEGLVDDLLQVLDSKQPTIVRQCLSSLHPLLLYHKVLCSKVENKLNNMDLSKYKDSMRPLIEKDIASVLKIIEYIRGVIN